MKHQTYESPPEDSLEQKAFCLNLLKAAPTLETHLSSDFLDFENWESYSGMLFMAELRRVCERLVDQPEGKSILPQVFTHLELKATELELTDLGSKELSRAERHAVWFLIFTFTDNPTGKDPEFPKMAPFMGPKILKHCTIC
jgi:hypothetical protein